MVVFLGRRIIKVYKSLAFAKVFGSIRACIRCALVYGAPTFFSSSNRSDSNWFIESGNAMCE